MISERHAKILEARGFDIELMERLGNRVKLPPWS